MRMKWSMEEERKETERKKRTLEEGMVYGKVGKKGEGKEREVRGEKVGRCGREKEGEMSLEGEEGDIEEGGLGMPHDVEITGIQNPDKPLVFEPTNKDWRVHQCIRLSLPYPLDLPEREIKQQLGPPSQLDRIVGDRNWLYRALSLELCRTQRHHGHLKELLVDFVRQPGIIRRLCRRWSWEVLVAKHHAWAIVGLIRWNICTRYAAPDSRGSLHSHHAFLEKVAAPSSSFPDPRCSLLPGEDLS